MRATSRSPFADCRKNCACSAVAPVTSAGQRTAAQPCSEQHRGMRSLTCELGNLSIHLADADVDGEMMRNSCSWIQVAVAKMQEQRSDAIDLRRMTCAIKV